MSLSIVDLRCAAIRHLHVVAGWPVHTTEADVAETMAAMRRNAAYHGEVSAKKLAGTAGALRDILAAIADNLPELCD